jgi:hypothetical protein
MQWQWAPVFQQPWCALAIPLHRQRECGSRWQRTEERIHRLQLRESQLIRPVTSIEWTIGGGGRRKYTLAGGLLRLLGLVAALRFRWMPSIDSDG